MPLPILDFVVPNVTPSRPSRGASVAIVFLGLMTLVALFAPLVAPYRPSDPLDIVRLKTQPPSLAHWFGTDMFSRDVLSRVLHGARVSLSVAFLGAGLAAVIGTAYGAVAGYVGGVVDDVMMRVVDSILSIPRILLLL